MQLHVPHDCHSCWCVDMFNMHMLAATLPGSKAQASMTDLTDEQESALVEAHMDECRLQKRLRYISIMKSKDLYLPVHEWKTTDFERPEGGPTPPTTPEVDPKIPKSKWEVDARMWRVNLSKFGEWWRAQSVPRFQ